MIKALILEKKRLQEVGLWDRRSKRHKGLGCTAKQGPSKFVYVLSHIKLG